MQKIMGYPRNAREYLLLELIEINTLGKFGLLRCLKEKSTQLRIQLGTCQNQFFLIVVWILKTSLCILIIGV